MSATETVIAFRPGPRRTVVTPWVLPRSEQP
jgi:hypothetical protein